MHTRQTALGALAITVLMFAVTGCGSSSSNTQTGAASATNSTPAATTAANVNTTTGSTPTPADAEPKFKARVESICTQRNHVIAGVTTSIATASDLKRVMKDRMAVEKATLTALRKVSVPASLAAPWRQFMAFRESLIEAEHILAREGLRKDQGTEIQAVAQALQEMIALAKREGFTACTQA